MADYLVTDTELTSIANAIRTKGGTSASLEFPQEFVQAINDIETGGGGGDSWIKGDGKTYLHINIYDEFFLPVYLLFNQNTRNGCTIDWGDGSTTTPSNTGKQTITHEYAEVGEYIITIANNSGTFYFGNPSSIGGCIFVSSLGESSWSSREMYCSILRKVELGQGWVSSSGRQFKGCRNMTDVYVSVPPAYTSLGNEIFSACQSLKHIDGVQGWNDGITTLNTGVFATCAFDVVPQFDNVVTIPQNFMSTPNNGVSTLGIVDVWEGVTTISQGAFAYQSNIAKATIPSTVTSIGAQVFNNCIGLKELHLKPTIPPTLSNTNAIPNGGVVNLTIYVPYSADHSILDAYQTASNWSTFASKIVEEEP